MTRSIGAQDMRPQGRLFQHALKGMLKKSRYRYCAESVGSDRSAGLLVFQACWRHSVCALCLDRTAVSTFGFFCRPSGAGVYCHARDYRTSQAPAARRQGRNPAGD
jgi:hypothetical protein